MTVQVDIFDIIWIVSMLGLVLLAVLHEYFGFKAYNRGSHMNIFRSTGDWIPETDKQMTLLGVFYMISFTWVQSIIITIYLLFNENPMGIWLGIVNIMALLPQWILLEIYVKWNKIARGIVILNLISTILWILAKFLY